MKRMILISRDPGATNQLVALRHILCGPDNHVRKMLFDHLGLSSCPKIMAIAKDYARDIWHQNGIDARYWPDITSQQDIGDYLANLDPGQIITGTCHMDDRTEQAIWRIARRLNIKTTAFLDSAHNIDLRFWDAGGAVTLPDRVAVIDSSGIAPLRSLGLSPQAIFISGDLYQDYIKAMAQNHRGNECRREWGAGQGESLILFASDYVSEMQAMGVAFDISEFDCLDCLIDILKSGAISDYVKSLSAPYRLVIRPHPKDTKGKYQSYPARSDENITILISGYGAPMAAILSSDMVAGLGSALLVEAATLGVGTLELGPIVKQRKDRGKTVS